MKSIDPNKLQADVQKQIDKTASITIGDVRLDVAPTAFLPDLAHGMAQLLKAPEAEALLMLKPGAQARLTMASPKDVELNAVDGSFSLSAPPTKLLSQVQTGVSAHYRALINAVKSPLLLDALGAQLAPFEPEGLGPLMAACIEGGSIRLPELTGEAPDSPGSLYETIVGSAVPVPLPAPIVRGPWQVTNSAALIEGPSPMALMGQVNAVQSADAFTYFLSIVGRRLMLVMGSKLRLATFQAALFPAPGQALFNPRAIHTQLEFLAKHHEAFKRVSMVDGRL